MIQYTHRLPHAIPTTNCDECRESFRYRSGSGVNVHESFNKTRCSMKDLTTLRSSALAIALCISSATSICAVGATAGVPAPEKPKNWTPPAAKLYVQTLTERIMAEHPDLISVTF